MGGLRGREVKGTQHKVRRGGEERKERKKKETDRNFSRNKRVWGWVGGGGEVGGRERGRGNILGKQSRAKIF